VQFDAAPTPRILWIELTSKCPLDCIFCSRYLRRGAGRHLPFDVFDSLVSSLRHPRKVILNYSGESTVYPDLVAAIRRVRSAGARAELVSALATAPEALLEPLSRSGLNRLTISVHAATPEKFAEVYRASSISTLQSRLERFVHLCREADDPPCIDLAFVAMDANIGELTGVAGWAEELGLSHISIFPVLRRDPIAAEFPVELTPDGRSRPAFEAGVAAAVDQAGRAHPSIHFEICNPAISTAPRRLGAVPISYPAELPAGAAIHTCEQNPWETTHVLSNGDVVPCEVLDRVPMGNLFQQPIDEIWHGEAYRRFRRQYRLGEIRECRTCPWKRAYLPAPPASEIIGARGANPQLLYGWHEPQNERHIWSSQQARAILQPRPGSRTLHVSGTLPSGPAGAANELLITVDGALAGAVSNPGPDMLPFGLDFTVPSSSDRPWTIEFHTTHVHHGAGGDQRDLGFAMVLLVSKELVDVERVAHQARRIQPLIRWAHTIDQCGAGLKRAIRLGRMVAPSPFDSGVSIVIPERDNLAELEPCLDSVRAAAVEWSDPLETIVVVNGVSAARYERLRAANPLVRWRFFDEPLGFAEAVAVGLRAARFDWVYLLNSDVVLDRQALAALAPHRSPETFSIASQILLKDTTRFREETNWTTLFVESGLATIHDWIPRSADPVPTFYAGGGASLFQKRVLERILDASVYAPFYWEDVEWGWRARKLGYSCVFCPASLAHHTQRGTISRCYPAGQIETTIERNRLLFQLRNFTSAGSLERVMEQIARLPEPAAHSFLAAHTRWKIAAGRLWNHLAPFTDEEVFARWNRSLAVLQTPASGD
jgi:MoaA/NifB/PqqE/SkfB family radical SAM enzyme/GT2 family glycosyltransferase